MSTLLISSESSLPPNVHGKTRGFLEIEVTRIKFAIQRLVHSQETTPTFEFISKKNDLSETTSVLETITSIGSQGATAKFIWWGESENHASSIHIVRAAKGATVNSHYTSSDDNKATNKDYCLLQQQQLRCSKVRYSIQTCLRLFLEYLQTCAPLEICFSENVNNSPLGSAQVRLPVVLLRKYAANYVTASNFEHKSKIYALYVPKHDKSIKCGEFQLKFKIMFAQNTKQLLQEQLQSTLEKEMKFEGSLKDDGTEGTSFTENSSRKSSKTDEIVEAMKKIDAKLVAYLGGEDIQPKEKQSAFERLQCSSPISQLVGEMVQERFREQQLRIYQRVNSIKMHMEALTLQPAGTKYMELMEEDIKPIFTVECQLSNELIKDIPRWDMFHIMQFESGQFQSLTQCTRFAQDAQRDIHFKPIESAEKSEEEDITNIEPKLNFGQLHFCVWWRQPGTCLNEMLGMANFDLEELYQASLLEQCKCLVIKRRNVSMANLYFKISFQLRRNSNGEVKMLKELKENTVVKESNGDDARDADEEQQSAQQTSKVIEAKDIENTAGRGEKPSNKAADMKKDSSNNNPQLENTQFAAETTKVRLLKGYVYANETRNLTEVKGGEYFLVCRRFWHEQTAVTTMHHLASSSALVAHFKYQEQFSILNDDLFLQRVEKQFLQLELWRKSPDDNGNSVEPFGLVRLPLHQYFIAYRDTAITNHLCKGKFPVISMDGWASIVNYETGDISGELKCLLAIGSEEQIENLKESRGLTRQLEPHANIELSSDLSAQFQKEPLQHPAEVATQVKAKLSQFMTGSPLKSTENSNSNTKQKKTSDLLDMLQGAMMAPSTASNTAEKPHFSGAAGMQSKPLQQANVKSFVFAVDIQRAINLPLNPAIKGKKGSKRNANAAAKQNRFPPNEAPSVYVTFQADEGYGKMFKSHEGLVYATNVVQKSTHPVWQQRFRVALPVDYLYNQQKRFILKIWKKAATDLAQCRLQPTPMEDSIIGFSAVDLTVFLQGMHIGGWLNIVDFNGRINGQLEVKCQPLEDVQKLLQSVCPYFASREAPSMDNFIDQFEKSLELSHLNLGQAIKRKFSELEQISQRLRTRLVDVTGEEFSSEFNFNELDNMEPLYSNTDSDQLDEFERDLKTPPLEAELEDEHKIKMISASPAKEPELGQPKTQSSSTAKDPQQSDAALQ